MTAIRVRNLRKSYGAFEAVRGIDFDVAEGEVFGFLGPNGAGKTTTVEILEGYRPRSAGDVEVLGHDPAHGERAIRERIGIVLQETGVERFLKVAEVLELYCGYYPHPRPVDELLALTGLEAKRDEIVKKLSGGQRRRLDLALGLAGDPDLVFLDEPTTGFDPSARREAWEVIRNLRSLGKTIFLTTHYMDEAQVLADRVAVIAGGLIVAEGPPSRLAGRDNATEIRFTLGDATLQLPDLGPATVIHADGQVIVTAQDPTPALHVLTGWSLERGVTLENLTVARPTLEDVYLQLTAETATT
ncbi:MAG TPA: ABC transporter ATP-binding protein [Acidimicrobiales bacterium]|nr:ABC transporter ATP-binding protein [Acidimicrobiales bacterium]